MVRGWTVEGDSRLWRPIKARSVLELVDTIPLRAPPGGHCGVLRTHQLPKAACGQTPASCETGARSHAHRIEWDRVGQGAHGFHGAFAKPLSSSGRVSRRPQPPAGPDSWVKFVVWCRSVAGMVDLNHSIRIDSLWLGGLCFGTRGAGDVQDRRLHQPPHVLQRYFPGKHFIPLLLSIFFSLLLLRRPTLLLFPLPHPGSSN